MMATLRIGVDVGGTNTDGVLLNPLAAGESNHGILAYHKVFTTPDPSDGIQTCVKILLDSAGIEAAQVASLTIGTTHFINAVIERDSARLAPVAVIRLCGPFTREQRPGIDWPADLASIICQHCGFVNGGIEVDGDIIRDLVEEQIAEQCALIKEKGIKCVVVNGIFSPADLVECQEERVGKWVNKYLPDAEIVLSKHVANLGFLERENAALLNASILPFARSTIASFERAARSLNLTCPVFLTQNDGTVLPAYHAAHVPIRTFNSGPTNSMSGAAFLVRHEVGLEKRAMLVVDIGGTTTDVGMLLPNGLPRQAAAITDMAGVRTNFSYPDIKSIGLGGGSIVRKESKLTIGPDSVGLRLETAALVFGGDIPTATDYAVAASPANLFIGDSGRVTTEVRASVGEYRSVLYGMLESVIDGMKTSAEDIDVLLVGGGAILVEDTIDLKGTSKVIKPVYSGVANAIGAAIARVSASVDIVRSTADKTSQQVLDEVSQIAIERAVENGALRATVELAEVDVIPVQYVANKSRIMIKAVGEYDFSRPQLAPLDDGGRQDPPSDAANSFGKRPVRLTPLPSPPTLPDLEKYRPSVNNAREWLLSERDVDWIAGGCYILGCGGGGSPYSELVRLREVLRMGGTIRVVSLDDLTDDMRVGAGCGMGSPAVVIEKLFGDQMLDAQRAVWDIVGQKPDAMMPVEIGGLNGLQGLLLGASTNMNLPAVDCDLMGRAYPSAWQITPVVLGGDQAHALPNALSDGNGNVLVMQQASSEKMIERTFRAALAEMGSAVGFAKAGFSGKDAKAWAVKHTISLAWRIGRAVALCRARSEIDSVADAIIDSIGGPETATVLFRGKIVSVERKLIKGHLFGEVAISGTSATPFVGARMNIPFKNENLVAIRVNPDGIEDVVATVPDLISVVDSASGEALGTSDYRYGLHVFVLGITGSEQWTSTTRGIEIGGPRAFGLDLEYKPIGLFKPPRSVIDEYAPTSR